MDAILLPFAIGCQGCGDMLAYEQSPRPPDFVALVSCLRCGWEGRVTLPRVPVEITASVAVRKAR
jgi:hypothetical protein